MTDIEKTGQDNKRINVCDLVACPGCGGMAPMIFIGAKPPRRKGRDWYSIVCSRCHHTTRYHKTYEKAAKDWGGFRSESM